MLEQSDIPLFLCMWLCLNVGFNFEFLLMTFVNHFRLNAF